MSNMQASAIEAARNAVRADFCLCRLLLLLLLLLPEVRSVLCMFACFPEPGACSLRLVSLKLPTMKWLSFGPHVNPTH